MGILVPVVLIAGLVGLFVWQRSLATEEGRDVKARLTSANTTVDYVPVQRITDDLMVLDHHHFRAVVQVTPLNFYLKDAVEQATLIKGFRETLDGLQTKGIELFMPVQRTNPTRSLVADLDWLTDPRVPPRYQEYAGGLVQWTSSWAQVRGLLTRRYYIVLISDYETPRSGGRVLGDAEIERRASLELARAAESVQRGLGNVGLTTRRLRGQDLFAVLYQYHNRDRARTIDPEGVEDSGVLTAYTTAAVEDVDPEAAAVPDDAWLNVQG